MKDKEILNYGDRILLNQLQQACEGLLWLSESDYPWETIYWDHISDLTSETLLQQINRELSTRIEIIALEEFFAQATQKQDWHEAVEIEEVERYQNLVQILQENLQDIKAYEVGEVEIDVYVLGKTNSNTIAGLKTKVIAT
jgi:Nuclease A inhibitor-like protein